MIFPLEIVKEISALVEPVDYVSLMQTCSIINEYCGDLIDWMKEKSCRKLWVQKNEIVSECLILPNNVVFRVMKSYKGLVISKYHIKIDEKFYTYSTIHEANITRQCENEMLVSLRVALLKPAHIQGGYYSNAVMCPHNIIYIYTPTSDLNYVRIINKRDGTYTNGYNDAIYGMILLFSDDKN